MQSVEFTHDINGNFAFFTLGPSASSSELKSWLQSPQVGYSVLGETYVNGKQVIIARGGYAPEIMHELLNERGEQLEPKEQKKKLDPWVVRSLLGFGGQSLQLASSFMRHRLDIPQMVFASSNLGANAINLVYKAQERDDPYRLKFLKQKFNDKLLPYLSGNAPIDINDNRDALREETPHKEYANPVNEFLKKNSVNVGELGLRYVGAAGLALPPKIWRGEMPASGDWRGLRTYAGLSSMFGKTVALSSKIADPYNPKPRTFFDRFREKFSFLVGGWIEVTSFSALAYDSFFNTGPGRDTTPNMARSLKIGNSYHRDWLGGIGAAMFVTGYIVRSWAKFGTRHVNMDELYAHVSDTLAMVPSDKLPQLLAMSAADIKAHFTDKPDLRFGTIYSRLVDDLQRQHNITLQSPSLLGHPLVIAEKETAPARADLPDHHVKAVEHAHTVAPAAQKTATISA